MFVVTLSPKRISNKILGELKRRNIFDYRVNFARNSISENLNLINELKVSKNKIFIDLPGEKLRMSYPVNVKIISPGELFAIANNGISLSCYDTALSCYATICDRKFFELIAVDDIVIIGDSNAQFIVVDIINKDVILLKCITSGKIYNKAGVIIQGKYINKTHLCDSDINILKKLKYQYLDYICVSFSDCRDIIEETIRLIPNDMPLKIIAKVESPEGIRNIDELLSVSDGVLLARSDLSKFYTVDQLAWYAELLKMKAESKNRIVIFASNYLRNSIQDCLIDQQERYYLEHDLALNPDYLYINETYYCPDILSTVDLYTEIAKKI